MNEKPIAWNNSNGEALPLAWNNSNKSKTPDKWSSDKRYPNSWEKEYHFPNNWGTTASDTKNNPASWSGNGSLPYEWGQAHDILEKWGSFDPSRSRINRSVSAETKKTSGSNVSLSDMANFGAGKLAAAAKKVGGAAKNAAGAAKTAAGGAMKSVAETAKNVDKTVKNTTGEVAKRATGAVKNAADITKNAAGRAATYARSAVSGAGSSISEIGEKASALMSRNKEIEPAENGEEYIEASVPEINELPEESPTVLDEGYDESLSVQEDDLNEEYAEAINEENAEDNSEAYEAEEAAEIQETEDVTEFSEINEAELKDASDDNPSEEIYEEYQQKPKYTVPHQPVYPSAQRTANQSTINQRYANQSTINQRTVNQSSINQRANSYAYANEARQYPQAPQMYSQTEMYGGDAVLERSTAESKTNKLLLFIIVFLVLIIGILVGMFLMLGRNNKSNDDNAGSDNIVVESTSAETIVQTEEISEETTAVKATKAEATTESKTKATEAKDDIYTAYKKTIDSKIDYLKNGNYSWVSIVYTLYDMDYDGSPELLIKYGDSEASFLTSIYTYKNGKAKELSNTLPGSHMSFGYDYVANQIVLITGHMGICEMSWYDLDNKGDVRFLISTGTLEITENKNYNYYMNKYNVADLNSSSISCTDINSNNYTTYINYYESGEYDYKEYSGISYKFLEDNLSDKFKNPVRPPQKAKSYTTYDPSEAGSDFTFYATTKECKINTEETELNLRAAPSTNAEVIKLIPKGTIVYEFGSNHAWSYISYSAGGTTYYGYVSKQFLLYTDEVVQVYSCDRKGRIDASSGEVAGFAGSYIVNGGTPELIRKSLGDGWHVTAVNYCYSKDILWYELYDSDDGDYYGWVDANYITFY